MRYSTIPAAAATALALAAPTTTALASGAGGGSGELHFVAMDEIAVPIVDGARSDGVLHIKLVLEAGDAAAAEALTAKLPIVRAASVAAALEFGRLYASPMMPVNAEQLAGDLKNALHHTGGVHRVLVTHVAATRA